MQLEHAKSPHIIGVPPRSIYGHDAEERALRAGIEMAVGTPRAVFVVGARRVIAIVQGRGPFSNAVRWMRIPHRRRACSNVQMLRQFMNQPWPADADAVSLMPIADQNALMNALTNGQFGRTSWGKTPTTAGTANVWTDLWPVTGNPSAGAVNGTAKTAVAWTDASTGAINHRGNVSTKTKHLLSADAIATANTPWLMFYDRVLSYDQNPYVATTNQTMTNVAVAGRYNSGAPGLLIVMCVCTVNGATATNITQLRYTNQAGTTLQTMPTTPTVSIIVSGAAPTTTLGARVIAPSSTTVPTWGYSMPLAVGDTGCQLINDYTPSSSNTGTFTFFLMHPLAKLALPIAALPNEIDYTYQIPEMEQIFDGACLSVMAYTPAATAFTVQGELRYGWN